MTKGLTASPARRFWGMRLAVQGLGTSVLFTAYHNTQNTLTPRGYDTPSTPDSPVDAGRLPRELSRSLGHEPSAPESSGALLELKPTSSV